MIAMILSLSLDHPSKDLFIHELSQRIDYNIICRWLPRPPLTQPRTHKTHHESMISPCNENENAKSANLQNQQIGDNVLT